MRTSDAASSLLDIALAWHDRGIVPIPLRPCSKRPIVKWRRLQEHKPPRAVIKRWFDTAFERNIGVLCGKVSNGLVVLDFDRVLEYHRWTERAHALSKTYTVETARGRHVYLLAERCPPHSMSMIGGDVKASGYVVAAPSLHPSGHVYAALNENAEILSAEHVDAMGIKFPETDSVSTGGSIEPMHRIRAGRGLLDDIKAELSLTALLAQHTQIAPSDGSGRWLMARCPFHNDRRPSMWVDAKRGICRCFRQDCIAGQNVLDVINVYALLHDISNKDAIYELAALLGLSR